MGNKGRLATPAQPRAKPGGRVETAYHEAGHAIASVALRIPVVSVTIIPNHAEGEAGHVRTGARFVDSLTWDDGRKTRAYAAQAAAGVMAATLYRHGRPATIDDLRQGKGGFDYSHDFGIVCDAALSDMGPPNAPDHEPYFKRALRRAERVLKRHWPAVEAVAAALLERETLTGAELRAIVGRHRCLSA